MNYTNVIGIDDIQECRKQGYLMIEKNGVFSPTNSYRIFAHRPAFAGHNDEFVVDLMISWREVQAIYAKNKVGLDSFADDMVELMSTPTPDYIDLLNATVSINQYVGLE